MTSAKKVDDAKKAQLTFTDSDVSIEHIERTGDERSVAYLVNNPQALAQAYATAGNASVLHNKNVLLCAVTAAFGGLTFGYDQGMISVTLVMQPFLQTVPEIAEGYPRAGFNKGLLTAILELGAMIGAAQTGFIADRFSRKRALTLGALWFIVGSIIQSATYSYAQLVVGRFLGGVGIGLLSSAAPLYISEIAPPHIRGGLLALEELMIVFGIIIAYWFTFGTRYINSDISWRLPFGLQIVPGLILFAGLYFLPYSPRWLGMQGRDDECLRTIAQLRNLPVDDYRVQAEYISIITDNQVTQEAAARRHPALFPDASQKGEGVAPKRSLLTDLKLEVVGWRDAFSKRYIKRTHVACGIAFFQQFLGINALIYYSPSLFTSLGLTLDTSLLMSGVMNVLQLVGCLPATLALDKLGRRTMLLWGAAICLAAHVIIASIVGAFYTNWPAHAAGGWAGVAFIFVYMLAFGGTWGPIAWAVPSEIYPTSIRAKGAAVGAAAIWFSNFLVGLITPPLNDAAPYGAFAFYAGMTFLGLIWTFLCVPETKGRSLEDMDAVFGDKAGSEEVQDRKRITQSLLDAHKLASKDSLPSP
ncbi:general substrate transporter [Schizophyllum commune]